MHYINDANTQAKTYQELMDVAINNGVEPKRVYIYLAALGVKSGSARVMYPDQNNYGEPVKMAITGKNTLVTKVAVCAHCHGLVVN